MPGRNIPDYWIRPWAPLPATAGLHRFVWDLHYPPPPAAEFTYPISAVPHDTPREPRGPWALPGTYTVRLTVGGRALTQPLRLKMDPRVTTPAEGLAAQLERSQETAREMARTLEGLQRAKDEHARVTEGPRAQELAARIGALADLNTRLTALYTVLQEADAPPTAAAAETLETLRRKVTEVLAGR